jgi:predicted TIM-barrel fold metal-dependent hydrolase
LGGHLGKLLPALVLYNALRYATEWDVLHKLLFGSDYPIASPAETLANLWRVNDIVASTSLAAGPDGELEKIPERDSLSLLGLA